MKAATRRLVIDDLAAILRKPRAGPIATPAEAIAIGLSIALEREFSPDSRAVWLVLRSLKQSGWKHEPL